jgi:hypothetical protein
MTNCTYCEGEREIVYLCAYCSGSGEGMTDGSRCLRCLGSGVDIWPCENCDPDAADDC